MKIILISVYPDIQAIGLRILSACLKKEGHDVRLIFLPGQFNNNYDDKILNDVVELSRNSSLVGISLMTNFVSNSIQITQKLKEELTVPILWGGIHPTLKPDECLEYADMVCIGEGEQSLVELARKMKEGQNYYDIQGLWFKDNNRIIKNEKRPLIEDLDSIPFPDYNYENHYILSDNSLQKLDEPLIRRYTDELYVIFTSRGCPFGCTYCCNNALDRMYPGNKSIRKRSIDNIINELISTKKRLPFIKFIKIDDDAFFINTNEYIEDFCKKYKKNIGLPFSVTGINPLTLTREKLVTLVDAGLKHVRMGIQTGNERTKKLYKRNYSNERVEKAAKIINEFKDKIWYPTYDIILDNPWETDDDLVETLILLTKLPPPYKLSLFSLTMYPETELYERAMREGILSDEKDCYRKNFLQSCKETYINRIFFLLKIYASNGSMISSKKMSLLTSQRMKQLRLNWPLYFLLRIWIIPLTILHLSQEVLKDIQKEDWYRINRNIRRKFRLNFNQNN